MSQTRIIALLHGNLTAMYTSLTTLTWVLHDYLLTIEDEIRYIWPHRWNAGKLLYMWIRYYGIGVLVFDVAKIHVLALPGATKYKLCVAMDSVIRIVGAFNLWPIEIMMQLRIYAIYKCSTRIALINCWLFLASIGLYLWILIHNALQRRAVVIHHDAVQLPVPGCPSIHTGIEWAQWVPATAFEGVLFGWALYKTLKSFVKQRTTGNSDIHRSLYELILRDNVIYFFGIACLLVFNNLMVVGTMKIPWITYSPFHAAMEVMTSRMLINLYKAFMEQKGIQTIQASTIQVFSTCGPISSDVSPKCREVDTGFGVLGKTGKESNTQIGAA